LNLSLAPRLLPTRAAGAAQDTDAAISGGLDTTVRVHNFNSTLEEVRRAARLGSVMRPRFAHTKTTRAAVARRAGAWQP
jgi:hypothetical protein